MTELLVQIFIHFLQRGAKNVFLDFFKSVFEVVALFYQFINSLDFTILDFPHFGQVLAFLFGKKQVWLKGRFLVQTKVIY